MDALYDPGCEEFEQFEEPEVRRLSYEENRARRAALTQLVPEMYRPILGLIGTYKTVQQQRVALDNRVRQLIAGKKVFWAYTLPVEVQDLVADKLTRIFRDLLDIEEECAEEIDELLRTRIWRLSCGHIARLKQVRIGYRRECPACGTMATVESEGPDWYRQVAIPAAKGIGISPGDGSLTAAKILAAYASPSRFNTIGQFIRYSGLAPENGQAPRRKKGEQLKHNPAAWQALWDLSETWFKNKSCYWRQRWDEWMGYYREQYPETVEGWIVRKGKRYWGQLYPNGRIIAMGRRKVLREFVHGLWDLWNAWEVKHGINRQNA